MKKYIGSRSVGLRLSLIAAISLVGLGLGGSRAAGGADFIAAVSQEGGEAFHPHLVRSGSSTTFMIQVKNVWDGPRDVTLEATALGSGFMPALSEERVDGLRPGQTRSVLLTVHGAIDPAPGAVGRVRVVARTDDGAEDELMVAAEISDRPKLYFLSIDSLDPAYYDLDAAGTGLGSDGDWLMPNLHRLGTRATYYPNAKVHIVTATDMNHYNLLAGTMTGTSGIPSVSIFFYGFDAKGKPITKGPGDPGFGVARSGKNGDWVKTIYNVAKDVDPKSWNSMVTGKGWIGTMFMPPEFQVDRVIFGLHRPDFVAPVTAKTYPAWRKRLQIVHAVLPTPLPSYAHNLGNPADLDEPQDRRETSRVLSRVISLNPAAFPPDRWVMDAAIAEVQNEDPDVLYILLAAVDDAGHAFGAAHDLEEWDDRGTPDVRDDVSKYDPRASRQGILNVVREADAQVGRFLDFLEERGTRDDAIIVAESDHGMITYYKHAIDAKGYLKKASRFKMGQDYFFGSAASIGFVINKREDPAIMAEVEAALENMKIENPVTGETECPLIVYNREELKTGVDQKTGTAWMLPREYYSEYYIEHRQPDEQLWPDLSVFAAPHYKFTVANLGLGNLGIGKLPFKLPESGYFIGGHGGFETRASLMMVSIPGLGPAVRDDEVWAMDLAPALLRKLQWPVPKSVDGSGLPGIDR